MHDILTDLRHRNGKSVEEVLQDLQTKSVGFEDGRRQLAAVRYYLRDVLAQCTRGWINVIKGENNYRTLLNKIAIHRKGDEPVVLVTFNYDLLLDKALADRGFKIGSMNDYILKDPLHKLLKLHGSVNWAHILGMAQPATEIHRRFIIDQPPTFDRQYDFALYGDDNFVDVRNKQVLFPALAIPMREKDKFECPNNHQEALRAAIPQVSRIIFIGWSAAETHFLKLLRDGLTVLDSFLVISGALSIASSTAMRIRDALGEAGHHARALVSKSGFSDFIVQGECDAFLDNRYRELQSLRIGPKMH